MYYFGVIKRIQELGLSKEAHCISCSGGALACAACFGCDADSEKLKEYVLDCATDARKSWRNLFKLREYTQGAISKFSKEEDVPKVSGKLAASMTVLPFMRNVRITEFHSLDYLTQCLLASSCVFPFAGLPVHVDGVGWCLDGAISDLQILQGLSVGGTFSKIHRKDSPEALTVTICPFYMSRADIKPSRYLPPWWVFFPPSRKELEGVFMLGYKDMLAWEQEMLTKSPSPENLEAMGWAEALMKQSSRVMRESQEYCYASLPTMPEMILPNLSDLQDHMPKLPAMPAMPHFPAFPDLGFIEHLPSMPSIDGTYLPQCLSDLLKTELSSPFWLFFVFVRQILICATAMLVYTELFWQTVAWGSLATMSVMLPAWKGVPSPREAYVKFRAYLRSTISPALALRSTPFVGQFVPIRKEKLANHSLFFRLFSFVIDSKGEKQ